MGRVGENIAGLLLAAGASTRMGRPKQLLRFYGVTLLERILNEALKSELHKIILVLGHQSKEIKKLLGQAIVHKKLSVIENTRYKQGISSSIITGLLEVEDNFDHVMILLADLPHVTSRLINLLMHRYLESLRPLGAIQVKSKRSHPVIFGRPLYPELHKLQGDVGARALFQKYGDRACLIEPDFLYDDMDIDTKEDYAEFQRSLENQTNRG
jgi:molybdenum cofactor cytidylyltransferase